MKKTLHRIAIKTRSNKTIDKLIKQSKKHPWATGSLLVLSGVLIGSWFDTNILSLLIGIAATWLVARYFYKESSKEMNEFISLLKEKIPNRVPSLDDILAVYSEVYGDGQPKPKASGSNSLGTWVELETGELICSGWLTIPKNESSTELLFPAIFRDKPMVTFSSTLDSETSFDATKNSIKIERKQPSESAFTMTYQAKGISSHHIQEPQHFKLVKVKES